MKTKTTYITDDGKEFDSKLQAEQRIEKLLEEQENLESLEFQYHTMCTISDYQEVKDQKEYVEFLESKLKNTLNII